jgi:hypothetical protein
MLVLRYVEVWAEFDWSLSSLVALLRMNLFLIIGIFGLGWITLPQCCQCPSKKRTLAWHSLNQKANLALKVLIRFSQRLIHAKDSCYVRVSWQ